VTSKPYGDPGVIELDDTVFASGSPRVTTCARPGNFTASPDLVTNDLAALKPDAFTRVV
jgi:hypothetical protein